MLLRLRPLLRVLALLCSSLIVLSGWRLFQMHKFMFSETFRSNNGSVDSVEVVHHSPSFTSLLNSTSLLNATPKETSDTTAAATKNNELWHALALNLSRPFVGQNDSQSSWCIPKAVYHNRTKKEQEKVGIMYVKLPKAASSTGAGVSLRIANNVARRLYGTGNETCLVHWRHKYAFYKRFGTWQRQRPSLLWTIVRHPAKRAISAFFHFRVARKGEVPTDAALLDFLERDKNEQNRYLATHKRDSIKGLLYFAEKDILDHYDFIGVAERLDESLVAFKILFQLDMADMIVLSSKRSGGYDGGQAKGTCFRIPKATISPAVQQYIDSGQHKINNTDYFIYQAVNRSLDQTIQAIGFERFNTQLAEYRRLQQLAEDQCQAKAMFPCSSNGTKQIRAAKQNCYDLDSGCGYPCINALFPDSLKPTKRQP